MLDQVLTNINIPNNIDPISVLSSLQSDDRYLGQENSNNNNKNIQIPILDIKLYLNIERKRENKSNKNDKQFFKENQEIQKISSISNNTSDNEIKRVTTILPDSP